MVTVEKKTIDESQKWESKNLILRTNVSIDIVKPAKRLAGNRCCARPKN